MAKKAIIKVYDGTQWVELDFGGSVGGVTTDDIEHAASGDSLSSFLDGLSYRLDVLESNGGGSSGSSSCNQYYGTCSTGSSTAAKVVVCDGFTLTKGARISVRFTSYNTATSPTLNVNSTGAKTIKEYGTTASYMTYRWPSGGVVGFVYDGTYWIMEQPRTATTTYYGLSRCDRVTLNGSTTSSPSFYAPTSAGTKGYVLTSNGSGAPTWTYFDAANIGYIDTNSNETNVSNALDDLYTKLANASGGSGGSSVTLNGAANSSPSFYAPTSAGASGQILVSNGSGAPKWDHISNHLNTDLIYDVEQDTDLTTTLTDLTDRILALESSGGSSGGSGGSSVYTHITTLYLAVDEVADISSYLSSYNEVLFNIDVSNDGTTTFGITNSTASWFNCGITTNKGFVSQIHIYKSTNKYMSPINMFSSINLTSCGSLDTYNQTYYIGNSTEEPGTSVEMIIQVYGR